MCVCYAWVQLSNLHWHEREIHFLGRAHRNVSARRSLCIVLTRHLVSARRSSNHPKLCTCYLFVNTFFLLAVCLTLALAPGPFFNANKKWFGSRSLNVRCACIGGCWFCYAFQSTIRNPCAFVDVQCYGMLLVQLLCGHCWCVWIAFDSWTHEISHFHEQKLGVLSAVCVHRDLAPQRFGRYGGWVFILLISRASCHKGQTKNLQQPDCHLRRCGSGKKMEFILCLFHERGTSSVVCLGNWSCIA